MKTLRNILFAALCLCLALPAAAQQNLASKLVGIWSSPYKTSTQKGHLLLRFNSNGTMEIIRSVTIEEAPHAAFAQISGGWQVSGNALSMSPKSTDATLQWSAPVREQVAQGDISRSKADQLYNAASGHLPRLNTLHFATRMQIKQITESRLILLNPKDSKTISFTRLTSYPKGTKLNLPQKVTEITIIDDEVAGEDEIKTMDELNRTVTAFGSSDYGQGTDDVQVVREVKDEVIVPERRTNNPAPEQIFTAVEEPPRFPGGDKAMYEFLANNIRYPEKAAQNNIQGRVTVQFVVEKDGSIGDVKVVRGKDPDLDKEAIRVVKTMPKFIPGKMNKQPVRVWYTLPINFKLQS